MRFNSHIWTAILLSSFWLQFYKSLALWNCIMEMENFQPHFSSHRSNYELWRSLIKSYSMHSQWDWRIKTCYTIYSTVRHCVRERLMHLRHLYSNFAFGWKWFITYFLYDKSNYHKLNVSFTKSLYEISEREKKTWWMEMFT